MDRITWPTDSNLTVESFLLSPIYKRLGTFARGKYEKVLLKSGILQLGSSLIGILTENQSRREMMSNIIFSCLKMKKRQPIMICNT